MPAGQQRVLFHALGRMLNDVLVRDFRCFGEQRLRLHPSVTMLVGRNAQGKTSLLEAICVLMRLQSPRTSSRTDLIRMGAASCLVEGATEEMSFRFAQSKTTRRLAVDGAVCGKSAEYLQQTSLVVWMDHSDMNLLRGSAEHRRRYMDFACAQISPGYLEALRNYERVLRSRNFLLKKESVIPWRQVDAYGALLERFGTVIRDARAELLRRLAAPVAAAHTQLCGGQLEQAVIEYAPGFEDASLAEALLASREAESRSRTTAVGTHRDDMQLQLNGLDAGAFASEGQQRTFSLALKLGQARVLEESRGRPPLLLMDDVFGELDPERRRALLAFLPSGSQKVITTTSVDWAESMHLSGDVWGVDQATLTRR